MSQIVEVPGHGEIEFPDQMSDAEIAAALKTIAGPRPTLAQDYASGIKLGAQGAKEAFIDPLLGVGETGLRLLSQSVAYPIAIGRGAREELNSLWRDDSIQSPPPGHPAAPRYGTPPLGPDGKPIPYAAMSPEQQAKEQEAWRSGNRADRWAEARRRGNEERASTMRGLTYDPYTRAGQQASGALESATQKSIGRLLQFTGRKAGDAAASVSGQLGAEKPNQEAARATANELAQLAAGAGISKVVPVVGGKARSAAEMLSERLRGSAISQGRKFLTGNSSPISTRKELSPEAVQAAYDAKAIRPFASLQGAEEKLWALRERLGDKYQAVLQELEAKGVQGPGAHNLALQLRQGARDASAKTLQNMDPGPGLLRETADVIASKADELGSRTLPLTAAEGMKRTAQKAARTDYLREGPDSLLGAARKDIASRLRQSVEDAVDAQSALAPEAAAQFVPLKRELGPVIEASDAASRAATRAANKQTFGLGSKIFGASAIASGNAAAAIPAMLATTAARNRGPATWGSAAMALANALKKAPPRAVAPSVQLLTVLESLQKPPAVVPSPALAPPFPIRFPFAVPGAAADEGER